MEAKELRIGNLIYVSNVGEVEITGLDKINNDILPIVSDGKKEFKVNMNIVCPVALNDNQFLKLGFNKALDFKHSDGSITDVMYIKDRFYVSADLRYEIMWHVSLSVPSTPNIRNYCTTVMDVHQIQNLFFAIENKELKLNQST